jgi:uncharacterized protein (DUF4415 family)
MLFSWNEKKRHSDEQPAMKAASSSKSSNSSSKRQGKVKPDKIRLTTEHPETNTAHIMRGIVRKGLQPLKSKTSISLRLDADVLDWYKSQGPGYQTRINAVLRAYKDAST